MIIKKKPRSSIPITHIKKDVILMQNNNKNLSNNILNPISSLFMETKTTKNKNGNTDELGFPPMHIEEEKKMDVIDYHDIRPRLSTYGCSAVRKHKIFNDDPKDKLIINGSDLIKYGYSFGNIQSFEPKQMINIYNQDNSINQLNQTLYQTVKSVKSKTSVNRYHTVNSIMNQEEFDNIQFNNSQIQQINKIINNEISPKYQYKPPHQNKAIYQKNVSKSLPTTSQNLPQPQNKQSIKQKVSTTKQNPFTSTQKSIKIPPLISSYQTQFYQSLNKTPSNHTNNSSIFNKQIHGKNCQQHPSLNTLLSNCCKTQKLSNNNFYSQIPAKYAHLAYNKYTDFPLASQMSFDKDKQQNNSQKSSFKKVISYGTPQKNKKNKKTTKYHSSFQPISSILPQLFSSNQKQQLKYIPQRIDSIEQRVLQQDKKLDQMNKKLHEFKHQDSQHQQHFLGELINMEQQLTQKQRQIYTNLDKINKISTGNNTNQQQTLKYKLQLQRAKRIESLYNENERLYMQLIKNNSFQQESMNLQQNQNQQDSSDFNSRFQEKSIQEMSPFAINPDKY